MRKVIFMLIFLGLLPLGCFCPESDLKYIKLNHLDTALLVNMQEVSSPLAVASGSEFKIRLDFHDVDYIASTINISPIFTSNAFATSCQNKGGLGLKTKIDSIVIFSDQKFMEQAAGTSLKGYFVGEYYTYEDGETQEIVGALDLLVSYLNASAFTVNHGFLQLTTHPENSLVHSFTIMVFLKDGQVLENKTGKIEFIP